MPQDYKEIPIMKTWDVYIDGRWAGTVEETTETLARCAAATKFEITTTSCLSVMERK
jgi:hypothetical protein